MDSKKLRQEFLNFFKKKGHKIVPSSSLIPTDPSVLFTTAGMQQFKPYYLGEKSPYGSDVATSQKCFRTSDIEQVGDESHLTFLEMLGNFSFGGYFKDEAISAAYELLNSKFKIQKSKITITVFGGDAEVPRDEKSVVIWGKFGFSEKNGNLRFMGREDNFWGPTGVEGPCGPTTEIHYGLAGSPQVEIWNLVFNEYYQNREKKLTQLKQKGVDTGMGLERLAMIVQNKPSVFETDLFEPIIGEIPGKDEKVKRIISDHIKSAVFLISEEIFPSNVERGYVLRRILRRAIRYGKLLDLPNKFLIPLAKRAIEIYQDIYPLVRSKETDILTVIQNEEEKFGKTLENGLKQFEKIANQGDIKGDDAFHLFDTYGFPLELTEELTKERNLKVDEQGFQEAFEKHREISRAGVGKKFGGVGEGADYESTKLHSAIHLLHAALRQILGENVKQMGSDVNPQRLRFDFSHSQKMTEEEVKKVEDLVNQKIKEDLEVKKEEMALNEALKSGALAFAFFSASARQQAGYGGSAVSFSAGGKEKYPERVTVYTMGSFSDSSAEFFSKEICAGPHVKRTSELGRLKITKEESSGAGIRRIRAILLKPR